MTYNSIKVTVRVNGELEQEYEINMQTENETRSLIDAVTQAVVNSPGWTVEETGSVSER